MFRALRRRRDKPARARPLLACRRWGADALCPIEWVMCGDDRWLMWMHCGECGRHDEVIVENDDAAAIDIEMDRQLAQIAAQADALALERMADEIEVFAAALERDLFDATDFAR